ncbi:MAG: type III-B CRISPR module RAMP protein Cmr1 [Verrucomicrobia bacterium]|nr:MAG: type III-B CRISPR module RAMP protein Cmr1 [Verrucomicrobiota bacterium]
MSCNASGYPAPSRNTQSNDPSMIISHYQLEIITPCFCAGADQGIAEIRAASIRGQLRWWFRVLGGRHGSGRGR